MSIEKCIKAAVILEEQTWRAVNAPFMKELTEDGLGLTGDLVRRIAIEYGVSRGIRSDKDDEDKTHATAVAAELDDLVKGDWPGKSLTEQAEACIDAATALNGENHTNGVQISAVTKLVWFLSPEGWTLFDKYASEAVGAKGSKNLAKAKDFYKKLDGRGFVKLAEDINLTLKDHSWDCRYAERIIDKFLWLNGAKETDRNRRVKYLLMFAPKKAISGCPKTVSDLACEILNKHEKGLTGLLGS